MRMKKVDRASMGIGLELRAPLLDYRVFNRASQRINISGVNQYTY
ncbi:asparagine synthase-related protein [Neomoorella humiferrea]